MEYHGFKSIYALYKVEVSRTNLKALSKSYVYYLWRNVMNNGVVDPATATFHPTHVRVNSHRGFSKCNTCVLLSAEITRAKTVEEEECKIKELRLHHNQVREDREELARLVRLCKIDPTRHVGFMIDAVDSNKFGIPTTEHTPKALVKLWRVKQKLTGVQFFGDDSVVLYRTLPDVPLGGNLTLTIILDMLAKGRFKQATNMYINLDGASDNICYHVYYGLAFFLRCAHMAGWPLHTITLLRFKVCSDTNTPVAFNTNPIYNCV